MLKKTIISVAFLLTYSLGLAHEFIPHCHHNEVGQNSQRYGQSDTGFHEARCTDNDHSQTGASANNFIDSVIALMSKTKHPATCSALALYLPSIAHDINALQFLKLFITTAILSVSLFSFRFLKTLEYCDYQPPIYSSPSLFGANLRGPPSFSC